jgi:hypothetical protein
MTIDWQVVTIALAAVLLRIIIIATDRQCVETVDAHLSGHTLQNGKSHLYRT